MASGNVFYQHGHQFQGNRIKICKGKNVLTHSLAREFGKIWDLIFSGSLGNLMSKMLSEGPCLSDLHEKMAKNQPKRIKCQISYRSHVKNFS